MRRRAMISADHETDTDGLCRVRLSLSDGMGEIASLKLLCGNEDQAAVIEENFRRTAELYYNRIMEMLLTDERKI